MGILFVLIFYAVVLSTVAGVSAVVLGGLAYRLTQQKRVRKVVAIFPFACVVFAGCWFVFYAVVNDTVFHRDPLLGDTWDTPLPNGYALMMIDTTDQGTVYNPKTQGGDGLVTGREDTEFGVRQLQVAGPLILGARDSGYFGRIGQESTSVDRYFLLDTRIGKPTEYKTLEELRRSGLEQGVHVQLREFQCVFGDYRTTWFDWVAIAVLLLTPAVGLVWLARWVWAARRARLVELSGAT